MSFHPVFDGAIFFFALVGGTIFSIHVLIISIFYLIGLIQNLFVFQFFYAIPLFCFYSLQLFNKRHNKSYGTLDNATAVASAFYNINYFKNYDLKNTDLVFVLTGAEEMGDYGADAYMKKQHEKFNKSNSYFLIPDTIGANSETNLYAYAQGIPKKEFSPIIKKKIKLLLEENDKYKIKPLYIPPLIHFSTDHAPLKPFGYHFMIFLSNGRIHSEDDNMNNFYPEMLENFNEFLRDLIRHMDENFKKS
jgi:hypothetical protein